MPALELDVALVHANVADAAGNAAFLGPDPYFDDLMAQAAKTAYVSCERVVATDDLLAEAGCAHALRLSRLWTDGVVEAPGGAWFTSCVPDYGTDEALLREYAATAKSDEAWERFVAAHLEGRP